MSLLIVDPDLLSRMTRHGWYPTGDAWVDVPRVGIVRVWTRGTPGDEAELPDNLIVEVTSKWRDS